MTLLSDWRTAMAADKGEAVKAFDLYQSWLLCKSVRVPGMDTCSRLAIRIHVYSRTIEEAAAREYLYRWNLTIDQMNNQGTAGRAGPFQDHYAPHLLGA